MQLDTEIIAVGSGIVSSLLTTAVGWGVLKSKVEQVEKDLASHEEQFVKQQVFDAHVNQLKADMTDVKADLKLILRHTIYKSNQESDD